MLSLLLFFATQALSITDDEADKLILTPAYLSDFINARQLRNLTVTGQKELAPIYSQYFTKPIFNLVQSLQPTYLQLKSLQFKSFDGMIINGEARGLAKFADLIVLDCGFSEGFADAMHVVGPKDTMKGE